MLESNKLGDSPSPLGPLQPTWFFCARCSRAAFFPHPMRFGFCQKRLELSNGLGFFLGFPLLLSFVRDSPLLDFFTFQTVAPCVFSDWLFAVCDFFLPPFFSFFC